MVLSIFVIAWGVVALAVSLLKPWAWIGFFTCMIMGLIAFILSLVWYCTAPGRDFSKVISQDVIVGPYLLMPGTLTVFVGGLLGGIFGLMAFVKSCRSRSKFRLE